MALPALAQHRCRHARARFVEQLEPVRIQVHDDQRQGRRSVARRCERFDAHRRYHSAHVVTGAPSRRRHTWMTIALVVASAFLHALWNAFLRRQPDKSATGVVVVSLAALTASGVAIVNFVITRQPPFPAAGGLAASAA